MALTDFFCSGFELQALAEACVSTSGTVAIVTSGHRTGNAGLKITATGTGASYAELALVYTGSGSNANEIGPRTAETGAVWFQMAFKITALPSSGHEPIIEVLSSASLQFAVSITSGGKLQIRDSSDVQAGSDSSVTISTGTYYVLQLHSDGSDEGIELWINGTQEISTTVTHSGAQDWLVGKPRNRNGNNIELTIDDVIIDATATRPDEDALVATAVPTGTGAHNDWSGTIPGAVDEIPPSDADYLTSPGTGSGAVTTALQNIGSMVPAINSGSTIHGVLGIGRFVRDSANSNTKLRVRGGTTNSDTANATTHTFALENKYHPVALNPADSAAWETADLDGAEVGAVETSTAVTRCTHLALNVAFTQAAGGATTPPLVSKLGLLGVGI